MEPHERGMKEGSSKKTENDDQVHACRILITCDHPSDDGKMNVEMSYDGDPTLASYLLERAQGYINQEDEADFC